VLGVAVAGDFISEVAFLPRTVAELAPSSRVAERACRQLAKYLKDPGFRFDLPLLRKGSDFQRRVWRGIAAIPAGQTRTYGALAAELHSAARAVGQACGANPYPHVIPCHRVVAAGGLGGFAHRNAGFLIEVKRWLLLHESGTA
jgi:methylated-DNA-[protein]-cysteine S-methyltransferase